MAAATWGNPLKYYMLAGKDQPHDNLIFFRWEEVKGDVNPQFTAGPPLWATGGRKRVPREMYRDFYCPVCQKVDEFKALARGLDPEIRIKAKTDFVRCWDGPLCCGVRAADVIRGSGAWGVDIIPLPGDPNYFLLWPNPLVKTDFAKCQLIIGPKCAECGRVEWTKGLMSTSAMELPDKHPCLIGSDIWTEHLHGRTTWLFADAPMREIIKAARLTGIAKWWQCEKSPPPWLDKWKASGGRYARPALLLESLKRNPPNKARQNDADFCKLMAKADAHPDSTSSKLVEFADASVADEIEAMLADPRYQDIHEILRRALKTARG